MKKAAKRGSAKSKAKSKPKAKAKAKAAKPKMKAKAKAKSPKGKKAAPKAKAKKASKGLSVADLFRMKQEREQAAQDPEAWKHKKELPPQDAQHPSDMDPKGGGLKKSGFGGVRHH